MKRLLYILMLALSASTARAEILVPETPWPTDPTEASRPIFSSAPFHLVEAQAECGSNAAPGFNPSDAPGAPVVGCQTTGPEGSLAQALPFTFIDSAKAGPLNLRLPRFARSDVPALTH